MKKIVIVLGCGRSGTLYASKVFQALGYCVGHEVLQHDGISSWYLVVDSIWKDFLYEIKVKNKIYENREFYFIHLLRNPLEVIRSMYLCEVSTKRKALDFVREHIPQFKLEQKSILFTTEWWLYWNERIEKNFPIDRTIRVEDLSKENLLENISKDLDIKFSNNMLSRIKSFGSKVHTIDSKVYNELSQTCYKKYLLQGITLGAIRIESSMIADRLKRKAINYGYILD